MPITRRLLLACAAALLGSPPLSASERVNVVATFSILGDLVSEVGGDRIAVTTLVGPVATRTSSNLPPPMRRSWRAPP